jgi:hypothetical protein
MCSAVRLLARLPADIFAQCSAEDGPRLPRSAMAIFAQVSGECGERTLLFAAALIFARVSSEYRLSSHRASV